MKEMNIEKKILSGFEMDALLNLSTEEDLKTSTEDQGMRCHGLVYIMGEFVIRDELKQFCEPIELDVYAPSHKLSEDLFHVELKDVNGVIDDGLLVTLTLQISGMKEDEKEESVVVKQEDEDVTLEFMEDLFEDDHSMIISKRLVVARSDDSYESIALRYGVDLGALKTVNHNKELLAKQLLILP